jgi:hypothetical protein
MHNNDDPHESEGRPNDRHLVTLLSSIYLEAGLPLELAVRAAFADFELFDNEILCAP